MDAQQHAKLNELLTALITAQDEVTHMNEKGREFEEETRELIRKRQIAKYAVFVFVEDLTPATAGKGAHNELV